MFAIYTFLFPPILQVKSLNEMSTIGKISKYWSGFVNNIFTNTANFGIQVPLDLDVKIKAVMIGACFLIVSIFSFLKTIHRNIIAHQSRPVAHLVQHTVSHSGQPITLELEGQINRVQTLGLLLPPSNTQSSSMTISYMYLCAWLYNLM